MYCIAGICNLLAFHVYCYNAPVAIYMYMYLQSPSLINAYEHIHVEGKGSALSECHSLILCGQGLDCNLLLN